jgi:hypothetical protein
MTMIILVLIEGYLILGDCQQLISSNWNGGYWELSRYGVLCNVFYQGLSFHFHPITLTGKEIGKDVLKGKEGSVFKKFPIFNMENALAMSDVHVMNNSFPIIDEIFLPCV